MAETVSNLAPQVDYHHTGRWEMNDTVPLFPELECLRVIPPPAPNWCGDPISLLAYWPRGQYWKIHQPLAFESEGDPRIEAYAKDLHERGWTHIHIIRLPAGDWPWNENGGT